MSEGIFDRLAGAVRRLLAGDPKPVQEDTSHPLAEGVHPRPRVFTVGHSSRTWAEFANLLDANGIQRLVDIRSHPHSRRHPQFDRDILRSGLLELGVHYQHLPELGGLRRRGLENSPNTAWPEGGFRYYADHMLSDQFRRGVVRLLEAGQTTALMCAEADPARCHRSLLSDYLVLVGEVEVRHILGPDRCEPHLVHTRARVVDGRLIYPAVQGSLF